MCASQDGQNCYYFPDVNTCQSWTSNTGSMSLTSIPAPASLGTTLSQAGQFIRRNEDGAIFWTRNGSSVANWVPNCNCPSNPCGGPQAISSADFSATYNQQSDYYCGMGSVVDLYNSQRV
jgi:hypothetical protein